MTRNKPRLYIALYTNPRPNQYHWALMVGPKDVEDPSVVRYHVKNPPAEIAGEVVAPWIYERIVPSRLRTWNLLARLVVAKIEEPDLIDSTLQAVPIIQGDPEWTCRIWVKDAVAALVDAGVLGTRVDLLDWTTVEMNCREYMARKIQEGRWQVSQEGPYSGLPTMDLITDEELVP